MNLSYADLTKNLKFFSPSVIVTSVSGSAYVFLGMEMPARG